MTITVPVYSEQELTADAWNIIKSVVAEYPPHTFNFMNVAGMHGTVSEPVLIFGSYTSTDLDKLWHPKKLYTYSVAQIMTKPNAASVLKAALNQFYLPQKTHPSKITAVHMVSHFDPKMPTAIDIETSGNLDKEQLEDVKIINIAFYQEGKWAHLNMEDYMPMGYSAYCNAIASAVARFENPIWHNGKFDRRVIAAQTGYKAGSYFDTMLAHHVLNHAAGDHKLKHLARQYLGAPEWEKDLSKYTVGGAHYENIPHDLLIEYNNWDVYWTYELWKYLEPLILADEQNSAAFVLEMSASDFLQEVEQYGFAVDVPYLNQLSQQMRADVQIAESLVRIEANDPNYNPGSWQQTQKVLTNLLGYIYTGKTDEKTIEALAATEARVRRFVTALLNYRKIKKALSTYVLGALGKVDSHGKVHTTFLIHGTTTGRLSSTGPNIQNIPRDKRYRSIYIGESDIVSSV